MLEIRAEAFETGAEMPMRLTQEGPNLSPALVFSGVPPQARSLVLIADDPDAPDPAAPKRVWLHWLVVNIDPAAQGFSEGLGTCPPDALAAVNDSGVRGWSAPRSDGTATFSGSMPLTPSLPCPKTSRGRRPRRPCRDIFLKKPRRWALICFQSTADPHVCTQMRQN